MHVQLETLAVVLGERPEAGQHVSVVAELVAKRNAKRGEVMLLGLEVHLLDEGVALAGTPLGLGASTLEDLPEPQALMSASLARGAADAMLL